MSRFEVDVTIERDARGRIESASVMWAETRPVTDQLLIVTGVMALFATLAGVVWLMAAGTANPLLVFGFLIMVASAWMLFGMPGKPRGMILHPDGRMETPHGIYYRPMLQAIDGHHRHVVSIEARMQRDQPQQGGHLFEVIMLSSGGDLICVSRNLPEWAAIRAAAQLTQMLNRIRTEQAGPEADEVWGEFA